jgi:hypothetical protein
MTLPDPSMTSELPTATQEDLARATSLKLQGQFDEVHNMTIRDKRSIFNILRAGCAVNENTFLPPFSLFVGEFCVWQILTEHARREEREGSGKARDEGASQSRGDP